MKEAISIAELVAVSGASARDIDNWTARFSLATKYDKGRGRARAFSRENALEIALIAALVKLRVQASDAASQMEVLFENWEHAGPTYIDKDLEWTIFLWGEAQHHLHSLSVAKSPFKTPGVMEALLRIGEEDGSTFTILNTGNIIRRVDNFFKQRPARKVRTEPRGKAA
jgi:hypothetical protein